MDFIGVVTGVVQQDAGTRLTVDYAGERYVLDGPVVETLPGARVSVLGAQDRGAVRRAEHFTVLAGELEIVRAFLTSFVPGIGVRVADALLAAHGARTLHVLRDTPADCSGPGLLRPDVALVASSFLQENLSGLRETAALCVLGLPPRLAPGVRAALGEGAELDVRQNPYVLLRAGLTFAQADFVARRLGVAPDDPRRVAGLVTQVVQDAQQQGGHTSVSEAVVGARLGDHLLTPGDVVQGLRLAVQQRLVSAEDGALYLPGELRTERELARLLRSANHAAPHRTLTLPPQGTLSHEQYAALQLARRSRVSVLTGGPGTGKSTTMRMLVTAARLSGLRLALAAPTGKAAARLSEVAGQEAFTLHRLLEYGHGRFGRGSARTLDADVVVVDEAGMIGNALMLALLTAVPQGARLIIAGDTNQLPPIDAGLPLWAMLGVLPSTVLTQVYRAAADSPITVAAYRLIGGELPDWAALGLPYLETAQPAAVAAFAHAAGAQLLTPMRGGPLGTEALNRACQALRGLQGSALAVSGGVAYPGDPVVMTRNDYARGVTNGMIGRVDAVAGRGLLVHFDGLLTPEGKPRGAGVVTFSGRTLADLMPAYALTVHRAQGSEWPAVCVALTPSQMLNRNLAYTAVTRAREVLLPCGSAEGWAQAAATPMPERHCRIEARVRAAPPLPRT